MSKLPYDEQFEQLAAGYFDQVLNDAGLAELKAMLHEDDLRVKRFAELAQLQQMIESETTYARQAEQSDRDVQSDSAERVFAELVRMEQSAESYAIVLDDAKPAKAPSKAADLDALSAHDLATVAGYVLRKALTSKPAYLAYAAAVVLLVGVLLIPWGSKVDTPQANQPQEPQDQRPERTIHVATLTATHDADWAYGAIAPGSQFHAGDRLTLTAGFAEITTNKGAVAILEAPATFELLGSNNALRLHSGKLVGICETESSKGLRVRTPHSDVTDLGTEFGVSTDGAGTTVSVMQGLVEVGIPDQQAQPVLLGKNQAATVKDREIRTLDSASQIDHLFARLRVQANFRQLTATGQIKLLPQAPDSIAYGQSIDLKHLQLFCEQRGVVLSDDLPIDVTHADRLNSNAYNAAPITLTGKTVDSYMLFASRTSDVPSWQADITQLKASITFDRPIVGLVGLTESLHASDAALGLDAVRYEQHVNRGLLNEDNDLLKDIIEISEDRKTLTIDCRVLGQDQLRILVASP